MESTITSLPESDSDSGSDGEEFKRARDRIRYVKEKLEREEFIQVAPIIYIHCANVIFIIIACIEH